MRSGDNPAVRAVADLLSRAAAGLLPDDSEARALAGCDDLDAMMAVAGALRDRGHGDVVSYSRKVFIPLTRLCRDSCHYCVFARPPRRGEAAFLSPDEVLDIVRAGARAGCREALFTLGDKPELRYAAARREFDARGHATTLAYLVEAEVLVQSETGLFPHVNAGVMPREDIERLRAVSISQGLMLETVSERLSWRGGPHFGSPDKVPAARLATIRAAGEARVPFTSGLLIGIGETRLERIEVLLALRALDAEFGHIQEIIIQNFRAKPGTLMADAPEPSVEDHLWTIAAARILFGPRANIQAPPNLSAGALGRLIAAGINDWGGISPVTPDHVNPGAPWPTLPALADQTARSGKVLVERLGAYPAFVRDGERWFEADQRPAVLRAADSDGFARSDGWVAGISTSIERAGALPRLRHSPTESRRRLTAILARACDGEALSEAEIVALFAARGDDAALVCQTADALRRRVSGQAIGYVVNRNINYTNVCSYRCQFCAFSKGRLSENLRGRAYDLDLDQIRRRAAEAWARGATEVCLQGGIHPGRTYLAILRAIREECPGLHVYSFSPLEVWQGAASIGAAVPEFLAALRDGGLGSLRGTAAEILDDEVRPVICPDKVTTDQWLAVVEAAHATGLRTTSTMMFGHVDHPRHWARHLLRLRVLQVRTGGITEFVPLPFVPVEAPIYPKGRSRSGPTLREAVLVHAVARLAAGYSGHVADSGEGRWTVMAAGRHPPRAPLPSGRGATT